ncbi:ribonuclease HII [Candidatus Woesearchaeota archaeon]|nr:ribonuclease HII [Candidatus Woesearchaeota archaeon]
MILGIDEAGRGPCIGPLVMCGVIANEKSSKDLTILGIKDSKLLTPKKREELFKELKHKKDIIDYKIIITTAKKVDEALNSEKSNLNFLEAQSSAKIIKLFEKKYALRKIITDCPSINTKSYTETLQKLSKTKVELISEHKADFNYPIVSAASILAKVTRDKEIKKIQMKLKKIGEIGSGYPSDPQTKEFLQKNWNNKEAQEFIRKTWDTYRKILESKKQKKLFEY